MPPLAPDLGAIEAGLRDVFPDAGEIEPCRVIGTGFNSVAVETAGGVIFRIARTEGAAGRYATEAQLLPMLRPVLPVEVPRPSWMAVGSPQFPLGVMGYPALPGVTMPSAPDPAALASLASGTAAILLALRRVRPADVAGIGLPGTKERRSHLISVREAVLPPLRERLVPGEYARVDSWWTAFLEDQRMDRHEPVLCHGDFWFANILVDARDATRVTGVVDWEHACIGDPALDFSTLLHVGEEFATGTIDAFRLLGGTLDDGFAHRMRRLWELREFYGVLYAVEFDDAAEMDDSIAKIRRGPILGP